METPPTAATNRASESSSPASPLHVQEPSMTVAVCGGGAGAHMTVASLGSKRNLRVNVLTRQPARWSQKRVVRMCTEGTSWEEFQPIVGKFHIASSNPADVVPNADVVLLCAPANAQKEILGTVAEHVKQGAIVGTIFGEGGFDWMAHAAFDGDWSRLGAIFSLMNIPWICRVKTYGEEVTMMGAKTALKVAAWPQWKTSEMCKILSLMFDLPCHPVPNFMSVTLCPSNQIIHPARYYGIFRDWDGKKTYAHEEVEFGMYRGCDDFSAEWMQKLDDDLQAIKKLLCGRYPSLDLTCVVPLEERLKNSYGDSIADPSSLKQIFRTNKSYSRIDTPVEKTEDGRYKPATTSRLFWEDIPFGLCVLKGIAQLLELEVKAVDFLVGWYQQFMGKNFLTNGALNEDLLHETGAPQRYGLTDITQVVAASLPDNSRE